VVVITGSDRKAGQTLLRAGAQDYLGKSWLSADSLTRAIDNAIERFAMLRERVKSEKSLRESEEQFRTLLESAPDAMVIVDQEGKIFLVNAEAERIFGYSRLELLGANVEMLIPARSDHRHVEQRATYTEHPKTRAMNAGPAMLGLRKDGTEFPIEVSLSPLKTAAGLLISSSIRDVTERVADKNSIEEGASRLALAVKVSGLAIAEINYTTGMNHLSADAARLFGLGEVAMTVPRASVHATFHPDDSPELSRRIAESLSPTGEGWFAMDHRVIWPNGEVHWLRVRKQVFFEGEGADRHPAHAMLASFDVTAEKNASEIVRAGGEFVRGVLDSLPEHVVVLDDLSNILAVNKPWDLLAVENGGALDASSVGLNYLDLCRNSIAKGAPHVLATIEGLEEVLNGSLAEFVAEYPCPAPGRDKWYAMHAKRMRYGKSGVVVSHVDITDTRRARSKLEDSETRFRRLFEAAHDGILILDASTHKITHVNPFLTTLLDYPAEHFLGKELWEIGFLKDKQASVSAMQRLDQLGSIRYESLPLEDRHGMKHPVEMVANKYEEGHHPVIQCNIRDISERRRLEKQMLAQASELSDLHRRKDEFLAMLSHELRSPLAPIANAVQLLGLQKSTENRTQQQARGIIERQVGQLQHLVDDLLEVSRITTGRVQLRLELIAMCQIAEGAVETVRPLIEQRRQELTVTLPPEPVWMLADAARLEQVLVNLLTNASKYTEGGGHIWLTVEVEVVASDEGRVKEKSGEWRVARRRRMVRGE
jgi:PAS domain S-box-containing protein